MGAYNLMQFWTLVFLFCTSDASISITPYDSLIPNEKESLECNKDVTLSCVTPANTLSMSWKEEGTTVADCSLGICSSTGKFNFTQDTSSGVFNLTLNPVLYTVHGNTFVCSAGVDSSTFIPDVKVMPDTATTTNSSSGLELEVTTGCVYPVSAITFKWYYMDNGDRKVLDNSVETEVSTGCTTGNCVGLGVKRIKSTLTTDSDGEEYNIYVDVIHAGAPENDQNYVVSKSFGIFKVAATKPPDDCKWWKPRCWECWQIVVIIIICLLVLILIGVILGCFLTKTTCCCECFYKGKSCRKCVNNYYCECRCCDKTPCGALCNIKGLPYWYQVLWATILGSAVAFGIWLVWRCCNNGNNDTSKNAVGTGSNPKNAGKKLLDQKKPSKSPGKDDDVKKENPASEKQNQHADQAHKVEIEGKKAGRPQPPPPVGANQSSQLPNIHTEGHDSKDSDDYHPLAGVGTPTEKAGTLPTITDTPRKTKKRTKKKKKDKQEDNQTTETAIDF